MIWVKKSIIFGYIALKTNNPVMKKENIIPNPNENPRIKELNTLLINLEKLFMNI